MVGLWILAIIAIFFVQYLINMKRWFIPGLILGLSLGAWQYFSPCVWSKYATAVCTLACGFFMVLDPIYI